MEKIDGIIDNDMSTSEWSGMSQSSYTTTSVGPGAVNGWYEALAQAWGNALDEQAADIVDLSQKISEAGEDMPSVTMQLSAESMRMRFLSNSASTSVKSVAQALEALARKQ